MMKQTTPMIGSSMARLAGAGFSQIIWSQARALGYSGQHARPDLLVVMKGKDEIGPARSRQRPMRA
jgi:hypothetical protein